MRLEQNDDRILADFASAALGFELIKPLSVIAWADELIAESETPANWMTELSLVDPSDTHAVLVLLRQVPGKSDPPRSVELLSALVLREWKRGHLDIGQVCGIGWKLHMEHREILDFTEWGVVVESKGEELDDDLISEAQMRAAIDRELARFGTVQLPHWL